MNLRAISNLTEFYLENRERIHLIIIDQKMKEVCDAYYRDKLNLREICNKLNMSIHEVNGRLLALASIMIRCKSDIQNE